ncbi:unnamed protein product [Prunus brigantina]
MGMEDEIKRLIKVCLSILASLCYTYFIASKIPKGKLRFFSLLPIFCLFTILSLSSLPSLLELLPCSSPGLVASSSSCSPLVWAHFHLAHH